MTHHSPAPRPDLPSRSTLHVLQGVIAPMPGRPEALYLQPGSGVPAGMAEGLNLPAGAMLRTDTFFNAFYLGHWRNHTDIARLGLTCRSDRPLRLRALAHLPDGQTQLLAEWTHPGGRAPSTRWIWARATEGGVAQQAHRIHLEVSSSEGAARIGALAFVTDSPAPRALRLAIGICTHNREAFLRRTLRALLTSADRGVDLDRIIVVNQGQPFTMPDLRALLDHPAVKNVEQPNLGGSGGFARVMVEATRPDPGCGATHLLLMDDDILLDPRILARAACFAAHARDDVALSGQALEIEVPERLQDAGGRIGDNWIVHPSHEGLDLTSDRALDRFTDTRPVDYGAWWFCLMPLSALRRCGLPVPMFLHGDDIDYGCRLRAAGVPVLSPPGLGLWHGAFRFKFGSALRYYDLRNGLINAAAHPDVSNLPGVLHILGWIVRDLLVHRYRAARAALLAVEDFLAGPDQAIGPDSAGRHRRLRAHVARLPAPHIVAPHAVAPGITARGPRIELRPGSSLAPPGRLPRLFLAHAALVVRALILPRRIKDIVIAGVPNPEVTGGSGYLLALDPKAERCMDMRPSRGQVLAMLPRALWLSLRYGLLRHRAVRRWQQALPDLRSPARWQHEFTGGGQ